MPKINSVESFCVIMPAPNFDEACNEAQNHARMLWGFEDGNLVKGWDSITCTVMVEFTRYVWLGRGGDHKYEFKTWIHTD